MSGAKRMMEEIDARERTAIDIALASKAVRTCEYHGVLLEGSGEAEYAYRVGNKKFSAGELRGVFRTRREMTDAVKEAIEGAADDCYICDKLLAD